MTRRAFFATLAGAFGAFFAALRGKKRVDRFVVGDIRARFSTDAGLFNPKRNIAAEFKAMSFDRKIGDTIYARKPMRFKVMTDGA